MYKKRRIVASTAPKHFYIWVYIIFWNFQSFTQSLSRQNVLRGIHMLHACASKTDLTYVYDVSLFACSLSPKLILNLIIRRVMCTNIYLALYHNGCNDKTDVTFWAEHPFPPFLCCHQVVRFWRNILLIIWFDILIYPGYPVPSKISCISFCMKSFFCCLVLKFTHQVFSSEF